jgi:hypothetical protein
VPRVDLAAERASIQQLLDRYVAAYNAQDQAQLKRIDPRAPTLPDRVLVKSIDVRMSDVSIDVSADGETASVRANQTVTYVWNRRFPANPPGVLFWKLRKVRGTWTVLP